MIPPIGDDSEGDIVRRAAAAFGRALLWLFTAYMTLLGWICDRTLGSGDDQR